MLSVCVIIISSKLYLLLPSIPWCPLLPGWHPDLLDGFRVIKRPRLVSWRDGTLQLRNNTRVNSHRWSGFTAWLCRSVSYPYNFMIRKYKMNLWKLLFCCYSGNHRQKFYYGHKEIMIPGLSLKLFFANNIQRYFRFLYVRVIFALC